MSSLGEEMSLRLALFGSPTIEYDGTSAALPYERRGQLLAFVALKRSWIPRAELAALLWPDQPTRLAYTNLRKTLFRLQSLPWPFAVDLQQGAIRLIAATDVAEFEDALRDGRIAAAIALRRGELLAGFDDDANESWTAWLRFERDRLRALWRDAALAWLEEATDAAAALDLSARLLDADPLDEAAARAQIAWLARSGQLARAHQVYDAFAQRLDEELGLAPGVELERLRTSLDAPPAAPPRSRPVAPPLRDDGFVGRSIELRHIAEQLGDGRCRLLTLVGPGGVGKTRLARRALDELGPGYADGGAFVPLDDVALPDEVGARLARELGVHLGIGDAIDEVAAALRDRHMLLVLDNFEQIASGAAQLQRLVDGCPRLTLVVTSRVRLGLAPEWVFPVEGLPCPESEDLDRIEAFDAARLFIQGAHRVQPALVASAEAPAIVDICRQVEGLPLALQLAAGWTRVLSCEAIADELRHGTDLLKAIDGAQSDRHASFEVVFDQSWRLLGDKERNALARLSVFRSGFSPEAARAVAGASLPVLAALADKSLLRKEGSRLQLHPLVQQLAAARLDQEQRALTREAHAKYFSNLLAQWAQAAEQGDRRALEAIDEDYANCGAAWRHAAAEGQAERLARCAPTLHDYFDHRARFEEGLALFGEAREAPAARGDPALRAQVLAIVAHLEFRLGRYADAEASAGQALAAASPRERSARYQAKSVLAACAMDTNRLPEAAALFQEALAVARAGSKARDAASTLENMALVRKRMGHYDEALRLSLEALAQHRRNGDTAAVALCLSNLGSMYLLLGQDETAAPHLEEAQALSERAGLVSTRAFALANLTELAMKAGDNARARLHAERALDVASTAGIRGLASWLEVQLARLAIRRGDLDAARCRLASGTNLALTLDAVTLKAAPLLGFVELLEAMGEHVCARLVLAFGTEESSLPVPNRDELRQAWQARDLASRDDGCRMPIPLDELLHRIVIEAGLAHAPLIAALRRAA